MRLFFITIFLLMLTGFVSGKTLLGGGEHDLEAIPDVVVSHGENDIAQAWLIAPTARYAHFVRGQQYEAGGVRVQLSEGNILTLMLDENHVFEDRHARLGDLDGDGRDEIILVLTSVQRGSALVAYAVEDGQLVLKAQTPFIGQAFRWLNPAGIADYNGDGTLDIALVQKPHLSKTLEFWTLENGKFVRFARIDDISNHHNGSPFTELSAVADFNNDGVNDLAILSGNYSRLCLFGFPNGQFQELSNIQLPAEGVGDFLIQENTLIIPLANGETFELDF